MNRMHRLFGIVGVAVLLLLASASAAPTARASPTAPQPRVVSGLYFDYFVVILMENQGISDIYGTATYMTSLANNYSLATHFTAIDHPSEPNYLALLGGLAGDCGNGGGATGGCMTGGADSTSDCSPDVNCTMAGNVNLVDRFEAAGVSWKAYAETLSTPCTGSDPYPGFDTVRHFPFYYFTDITTSAARCAKTFAATSPTDDELVNSLGSTATAANFTYLSPNDCHNIHSCAISDGDSYLSALVPRILGSTIFQTKRAALLITFDEGSSTQYPTDYVYTAWAGPVVKRGYSSTTEYTTYSFLSTLEANWGLAPLQATDTSAPVMSEFFGSVTPPSGPTARFTFSPGGPLVNQVVTFDASTSTDSDTTATLQARWDWEADGTWDTSFSSTLTATHAYAATGTYTVRLEIQDSHNLNSTITHQISVLNTADTTPPATAEAASGTIGGNNWYTTSVSVTLTATDDASGVATIHVRVDGGTWSTYSAPVVLSGDGTHTLDYYATDNAGNDETTHTVSVRIDGTGPTFGAVSPSGTVSDPNVTVSWTASDDLSGLGYYEVSVDGGAFANVSTTTSLSEHWTEGGHSVIVKAYDVAGNSASKTIAFTIQTSPGGTPTQNPGGATLSELLPFVLAPAIAVGVVLVAFVLARRRLRGP